MGQQQRNPRSLQQSAGNPAHDALGEMAVASDNQEVGAEVGGIVQESVAFRPRLCRSLRHVHGDSMPREMARDVGGRQITVATDAMLRVHGQDRHGV